MVQLIQQVAKPAFRFKIGFIFAFAVLFLLTSCETTNQKANFSNPVYRNTLNSKVGSEPPEPSLEARKLKDWIQL